MTETLHEIAEIVPGPISAEVVGEDFDTMISEGSALLDIAQNIVIKVPMTWNGLKACKKFSDDGHAVNVTLCFSVNQALLAAKAGATYVSPFVGRIDDIALCGIQLIDDIRHVYDNYGFETLILAASIRTVSHVADSALSGADCITAPPSVMEKLIEHPLTQKGLSTFTQDWKNSGHRIV
jgi:transaldolase